VAAEDTQTIQGATSMEMDDQRRPEAPPITVRLEAEAYALLRDFAPTGRQYGAFLSRLLYEERARREGRQEAIDDMRRLLAALERHRQAVPG
jgi:hypothetical protein